jgi:thiamine-monophosphate kinase
MDEFALIRRWFDRKPPDGVLGVGDDCALLPPVQGQLAVSKDLLIEGRHFFPDVDPQALGHKALAVNLSDLAAMGAEPVACWLGLALPAVDAPWLDAFAAGFHALADRSGCPLLGGDTTRSAGPITISVTVLGEVPQGLALCRRGARVGDDIWLSGTVGDADLALRLLRNDPLPLAGQERAALLALARVALEWPQPRLALGQALRGIAHSAIDVSDGLLQDLGHILMASDVGAEVWADSVPVSEALEGLPPELQRRCALGGGDAYELCFTAPVEARGTLQALSARLGLTLSPIGTVVARRGLRVLDAAGKPLRELPSGFNHFSL